MRCIEQDSLNRRRSVYDLSGVLPISENCFIETIESCILNCPTPFNIQSARVVVLFGKKHLQIWNKIWEELFNLITDKHTAGVKKKIDAFMRAYGTILFFEDRNSLMRLKKQFPQYAKNMRVWTEQANGMLQYMIWQALSDNEVGASLQHYNELIDKTVNKMFNLPKTWKIVAQMPFGSIATEPSEKTFLPIEERLKILR